MFIVNILLLEQILSFKSSPFYGGKFTPWGNKYYQSKVFIDHGDSKQTIEECPFYAFCVQAEHFAILLTFIKLPFVIKIFVLSI